MTITLELAPEIAAQLREAAAEAGLELGDYARTLLEGEARRQALEALRNQTPPQSLADLKPRVPPPPGTTGLAMAIGQWPGDETDEEIEAALEELS
jgi:hypothetical protein